MMALLDGKVIMIIGVGRGLGKEVAKAVLAEKGSVIMGDLMEEQLKEIQNEIDPGHERSFARYMDITDKDSYVELMKQGVEKFGKIDGLIQVAAYDQSIGGLLDGNLADWDKVSDINIKGVLEIVKEAVPYLQKDDGGSIVFIGSTAALVPSDQFLQLSYGIGKGALITATHYLSRELGPLGIRVNNIGPGYKWGPVLEAAFKEQAEHYGVSVEEIMEPVKQQMSLKRFASDEDVAKACVFFCSDYAKNITGQTLYVDAGFVLH